MPNHSAKEPSFLVLLCKGMTIFDIRNSQGEIFCKNGSIFVLFGQTLPRDVLNLSESGIHPGDVFIVDERYSIFYRIEYGSIYFIIILCLTLG